MPVEEQIKQLQREIEELRVILFKKTGSGPSEIKNKKILVDELDIATSSVGYMKISDAVLITDALSIKSEDTQITSNGTVLSVGGIDFTPGVNVLPADDNSIPLGSASKRWSDVRSVLINGLDYCFDNKWTLTEHDRVGIEEKGIAVLDEDNNLVAFIGKDGIYANIKDIKGLKWTKTTQEERIKWPK